MDQKGYSSSIDERKIIMAWCGLFGHARQQIWGLSFGR
jgi:hypothetical protein